MFVKFRTSVEKQLDFKIKSLQSDDGGEFKAFSSYLVAHGIKHRFSYPYTPERNGWVERKLRQVTETGLALLTKASLPLSFWLYAFHTAIFLINCLPTKMLKYQSPFQTLFGKTTYYHFLKTFGCLCYPYIRPYNKHKLQYRSTLCIFHDYSNTHKGYLCFDPKTTRLYITRHVVFHESIFPTLSPSTSSNPSFFPFPLLFFFPYTCLLLMLYILLMLNNITPHLCLHHFTYLLTTSFLLYITMFLNILPLLIVILWSCVPRMAL